MIWFSISLLLHHLQRLYLNQPSIRLLYDSSILLFSYPLVSLCLPALTISHDLVYLLVTRRARPWRHHRVLAACLMLWDPFPSHHHHHHLPLNLSLLTLTIEQDLYVTSLVVLVSAT